MKFIQTTTEKQMNNGKKLKSSPKSQLNLR